MGTADGRVIGTTRIVDNGSPAERFNLVVVAEGYEDTVADMTQFANDAQQFINRLFATSPFNNLRNAFNVFRIDVGSTDQGADDPAACGGSGATRATYFDASFCNGNIRRLLQVNTVTVLNVVNAQVPEWHQILVIVNSTIWGGSGGSVGVTSKAPGWEDIAIHEFGHAAFGLADEYEYWEGCGIDTDRNNHPNTEPTEPNVTIDTNRATIKWRDLILATIPVPTTTNANCAQCDPQPNPVREILIHVCLETRTQRYRRCDRQEDQGYQGCDRWEDRGYQQCNSWSNSCSSWLPWPLSYICNVFEWICNAWVWISNWVCVTWTWVSHIVCVVWTWVSYIVCVIWSWIRIKPEIVGVFEGAHYFHCGAFRPEFDCMMRNFGPFCAVCRRRINETLSPHLP